MGSLDLVRLALLSTGLPVSYIAANKKNPPYIVWADDGTGDAVHGGNRLLYRVFTGTIDLFQSEGDPTDYRLLVERALDGSDGIAWSMNSIQHEDDTGLVHYEWDFEVAETFTEGAQNGND